MVDTMSKNESIPNTRLRSKNKMTPKRSLRLKDVDEMSLKENDSFTCSSNQTEKMVIIKLYHNYLKYKGVSSGDGPLVHYEGDLFFLLTYYILVYLFYLILFVCILNFIYT